MKCPKSGKQIHLSAGKACAQLRSLQEHGYEGEAYFCKYCSGWHVGRLKKNAHRNKYKKET